MKTWWNYAKVTIEAEKELDLERSFQGSEKSSEGARPEAQRCVQWRRTEGNSLRPVREAETQ